ncbi:Peridinin-chlorophyll a-binding protein, chloroplastic [Symbiodinium microadriaticum]|uniref:Peridinin-chlorophyll a-binding protein, chloroplastic n=1 Tax=Symbiodinium microadriaticum TaxID=2951 RepID=A0A1Q9CVQ3_SYMMI|nr:Peridinin-chlorophyll a-binding protein, chloroplastic [Symbiodinium microadriaticum]
MKPTHKAIGSTDSICVTSVADCAAVNAAVDRVVASTPTVMDVYNSLVGVVDANIPEQKPLGEELSSCSSFQWPILADVRGIANFATTPARLTDLFACSDSYPVNLGGHPVWAIASTRLADFPLQGLLDATCCRSTPCSQHLEG